MVADRLAEVLKRNHLTLYTNRRQFMPSKGVSRVSTQRLSSSAPRRYGSRAEALAQSSGIQLGLRNLASVEGQSLTIVGRDGEKKFTGALARNRIGYIPPERLGGEKVAVDTYVSESALHLVVDAGTFGRWLHSGSISGSRVPASWWERRALTSHFINLKDHRSRERSERFFECVMNFHAEGHALCKSFRGKFPHATNELSTLIRALLINMMHEGRCESSAVRVFEDAVEVIHRDDIRNQLEQVIKAWPKVIQISAFRLRRSLYSDEWNPERLQDQACQRLQQPPLVLSERGASMLAYWQHLVRNWIRTHPGDVEACSRPEFHKSSASLLSSRKEGGGSRELHLVVGLYRLHLGHPSALSDVFEQVSDKDTVASILAKHSRVDQGEVIEACLWWCRLIEHRNWPLGMMIAIFPERERKGRTFTVPWVAPEILASPAVKLAKRFLAAQPESRRACKGGNSQFQRLVAEAAKPGRMRVDLDSSQSTDWYGDVVVGQFYEPFLEVLPDYVRTGVEMCGKRGKIALAKRRSRLLDHLSTHLFTPSDLIRMDVLKKAQLYPRTQRVFTSYRNDRILAITPYEERLKGYASEGPFILKAFPGAGKTTWMSTQKGVVISLPSIAQCVMLSQSLTSANIEHCCYWTGRERPDKGYLAAIICTTAHVHSLLKENRERWYLCDEADTPLEGGLLAMMDCLKAGRFFVACSATPEALDLPLPTLEILGESNFSIEESEILEADLAVEIQGRLKTASSQVLVVVHSEPKALQLERSLIGKNLKARALLSAHSDEETVDVLQSPIAIATNKVRSSINLPELEAVFDYQRRYQYITDRASGVVTGVITHTSEADHGQLRGRVGRVKGGAYIKVQNNIPCSDSMAAVQDMEEGARLSRELDLGAFPMTYSKGSLEYHARTTALAGLYVGKNFFGRGLPANIRLLRRASLLESHRVRLGLVSCFEMFGFRQRLAELTRTGDPELEALEGTFQREVVQGDFSIAYANVFIAFLVNKLYHRETSMVCRWLNLERSEHGVRRHLDSIPVWSSERSRAALSVLMWSSLARREGHEYVGLISTFRAPCQERDPQFALLLARTVDMHTGTITYQRALPSGGESTLVQGLNGRIGELELPTVSEDVSEDYFISLQKSGHRPYLRAGKEIPASLLVVHPSQLDQILDRIGEDIDQCTREYRTLTSGVNMASRISPRILLGLCWLAGLEAQRSIPDLLFEVFGDDFAAVCKERPGLLRFLTELRAEFGMKTKPSASAEQRQKETLTVITERFFGGEGTEEWGMKPSSFVKLFLSQNASWSIFHSNLEKTDFIGEYNFLMREFPDAVKALGLQDPSKYSRRRKRVTHSRRLARKLLEKESRKDASSIGMAPPPSVEQTVSDIEEKILLLTPSTRGQGLVMEHAADASYYSACPQRTLKRVEEMLHPAG